MSSDNTLPCPVCGHPETVATVRRDRLPAMQNYVHRTLEGALAARSGPIVISVCRHCGYAFNSQFDGSLLVYDQGYDNSVPSRVMEQYYRDIARYLYHKYHLNDGLILDIGCGKGTFLKVLAEMFPDVHGLGVDPSYEGEPEIPGTNLRFIRDFFNASHVEQAPSVVICRHVLEHIPQPTVFLQSISASLSAYPGTPFFLEVPDALWILNQHAFWDFCYEHVNYFTPQSLARTLNLGGFETRLSTPAYGDQYQWIEGISRRMIPLRSNDPKQASSTTADQFIQYSKQESAFQTSARSQLEELKAKGSKIAVWGMATKGVVFANLIDSKQSLIDYCIDVNAVKQGCYLPITGHQIKSPDVLREVSGQDLAVLIMNQNYRDEIVATCHGMNVHPTFITM